MSQPITPMKLLRELFSLDDSLSDYKIVAIIFQEYTEYKIKAEITFNAIATGHFEQKHSDE